MIFQEPTTSLNPCFTVGFQITEAIKVHLGGTSRSRRDRAVELLTQVGADPEHRLGAFPRKAWWHVDRRAMIAMAIACNRAC